MRSKLPRENDDEGRGSVDQRRAATIEPRRVQGPIGNRSHALELIAIAGLDCSDPEYELLVW